MGCCSKKSVEVADDERSPNGKLQFAASECNIAVLRETISQGGDVNAPEEIAAGVKNAIRSGNYPLHMAAEKGHVEAVNVLKDCGALLVQ